MTNFTDSKLWRCLDPDIFDGINSISKTQHTSSYSWIISIVYLISLMIKYRVNSTGLLFHSISLLHLCLHSSWIPAIYLHHIFPLLTQLLCFLPSFAAQPPSTLPLFLIWILSKLLCSSNSHRFISKLSSCYHHISTYYLQVFQRRSGKSIYWLKFCTI